MSEHEGKSDYLSHSLGIQDGEVEGGSPLLLFGHWVKGVSASRNQ